MKKNLLIALLFIVLLFGCAREAQPDQVCSSVPSDTFSFTRNEKLHIVSDSGIAYKLLAHEEELYYLGELEYIGFVQGEAGSPSMYGFWEPGMYALKAASNDNILIRYAPENEWFSIYRKASLPDFDFSADNCIRLELVPGNALSEDEPIHISCGDGITDRSEIAAFLSEIRSQPDPQDAGLYEMVQKPDGTLENCYLYGTIYGFFEEEPCLVVEMDVWSYNDLAFSVSIEGEDHVLPAQWLQRLQNN